MTSRQKNLHYPSISPYNQNMPLNIIRSLKKYCCLLFITYLLFFGVNSVHSQGLNVASTYDIADPQAVSGDILIASAQGIKRSSVSYDNKIIGVILDNPIMVLKDQDTGKKA